MKARALTIRELIVYCKTDYYENKQDKGKEPWDLIPEVCFRALMQEDLFYAQLFIAICEDIGLGFIEALAGVKEVLQFGLEKYSFGSWKDLPNAQDRYYAAYMRHSFYENGELLPRDDLDEESGLHSFKHALCNIIFLLWFEIKEIKEKENEV